MKWCRKQPSKECLPRSEKGNVTKSQIVCFDEHVLSEHVRIAGMIEQTTHIRISRSINHVWIRLVKHCHSIHCNEKDNGEFSKLTYWRVLTVQWLAVFGLLILGQIVFMGPS